jgi:hypothetical protein
VTCHLNVWWTQLLGLLSTKTCKTTILAQDQKPQQYISLYYDIPYTKEVKIAITN